MEKNSMDLEVQYQQNKIGPDIFGFYKQEISDLLAQDVDENFSALSSRTKESVNVYSKAQENEQRTDNPLQVGSLFGKSLQNAVPGAKRELLKSSLTQSVRALAHEVDEIVDPVVRTHHILSSLKSKKHLLARKVPLDRDSGMSPCKKQSKSSNAKRKVFEDQSRVAGNGAGEVNEALKFLIESEDDTLQLEKTIIRHSDELDVVLNHMQEQLEELLDVVVSKCRSMTQQEKQQLCKLIQNLPPKNLDRVVEIIQANHGKSSDTLSSDEISIELEEQGNVTLWRLYFYVKAVENARKLSA